MKIDFELRKVDSATNLQIWGPFRTCLVTGKVCVNAKAEQGRLDTVEPLHAWNAHTCIPILALILCVPTSTSSFVGFSYSLQTTYVYMYVKYIIIYLYINILDTESLLIPLTELLRGSS